MQAAKKFSAPSDQPSQEFNLTLLIRQIHFRRDISNGAKLVAVHLLMACGRRGYCSIPIKTLAWELDMRLTQLHCYVRELVEVGYLERQAHPGRANTWIIPEVRKLAQATPSACRRTIFKNLSTENVKNPEPPENVISISSQEQPQPEPPDNSPQPHNDPDNSLESHFEAKKPIRMDVVKALVEVTNDRKSFGLWCKVARDISLDNIRYCVESLRIAVNDNTVRNRGRYLTAILKSRHPEIFIPKTAPVSQFTTNERSVTPANCPTEQFTAAKKHPSEPVIEPKQDYKTGLAEIAKIKAMLNSQPLSIEARERQLATLKQNTVPQKVSERHEPVKNRDNESAVHAAKGGRT